jgi:hypothetical protein
LDEAINYQKLLLRFIQELKTGFTLIIYEGIISRTSLKFKYCTITKHPTHDSKKPVPVTLPAAAEMLAPFHALGKRLLSQIKQ